jgi:hypothetical protein
MQTLHFEEVLVHSPGRTLGPLAQRFGRPSCRLIGMAGRAGIGNLVFIGHRGSDEIERVGAYEHAGNRDFDFRHVAGYALVPR